MNDTDAPRGEGEIGEPQAPNTPKEAAQAQTAAIREAMNNALAERTLLKPYERSQQLTRKFSPEVEIEWDAGEPFQFVVQLGPLVVNWEHPTPWMPPAWNINPRGGDI